MINFNSSIFSPIAKFDLSFLLKTGSIGLLVASSQTLVISSALASNGLTTKETFEGKVNYTVTGGTLRNKSNNNDACSLKSASTAKLSDIPNNGTVKKAYLYWSGSGSTIDNQVKFAGTSVTADQTYTDSFTFASSTYNFFQGVKDVTNIVANRGNGNYQFKDLEVDSSDLYCDAKGVLSAWSLVVIYDDPSIDQDKLNTIKLYEGLKVSRNQSVTYTLDGIKVTDQPVAKFSMLLWEGDSSLGGDNEYFSFNDNILTDDLNPETYQFNSTINSLNLSNTYGVDFDTFDVSNYVIEGQTSIQGEISTDDDLVLQGAAILMVTDELANQAPNAQPDVIITDEDTPVTYNVITGDPVSKAGQDSDPEGNIEITKLNVAGTEYTFETEDSHSITMPSGALLTVDDEGNVTYDPNGKFESLNPGEVAENLDEFTYTVADEEGATGSATATMRVGGAADNPVAQDDNFVTDEDTAKRIHVLRNDNDPNTTKENLRVTAINGTPVGLNESYTLDSGAVITVKNVGVDYKHKNGDYTLFYDPTKSKTLNLLNTGDVDAEETFTYTVADPEGNTGEGNVTINVEGITELYAD